MVEVLTMSVEVGDEVIVEAHPEPLVGEVVMFQGEELVVVKLHDTGETHPYHRDDVAKLEPE